LYLYHSLDASTTISPIMSERSERFIHNISVYSYLRSILTAAFFAIFILFISSVREISCVREISSFIVHWISIWIILSTHRPRFRLSWASAASDWSITFSVYSYLRSILTAAFFAIFILFISYVREISCVREISSFIVYWISILIFLSTHRFRFRILWASAASDSSITSPSILYGRFFRHFYSFHFICSRDFIIQRSLN